MGGIYSLTGRMIILCLQKRKKPGDIIKMSWLFLIDPFGEVCWICADNRSMSTDRQNICISSWPQITWCLQQANAASSKGSLQFDSISQLCATQAVAQAQAEAQRQSVKQLTPEAWWDWHPMWLSNNSWQTQCKGECLCRDSMLIWKGQQKHSWLNCLTLRCLF